MNLVQLKDMKRLEKMENIANSICQEEGECEECSLYMGDTFHCVLAKIEDSLYRFDKISDEPTYEELPIDLDDVITEKDYHYDPKHKDYRCDECDKPNRWGCYNEEKCREDYPFGECCADNLRDNVANILFKYDIIDSKLAKAIVEILEKERERNESLYVHRKYIEDK